jgi:hypothetical protein
LTCAPIASCAGSWAPCTSMCEWTGQRSFVQTVAPFGGGAACPSPSLPCALGEGGCTQKPCLSNPCLNQAVCSDRFTPSAIELGSGANLGRRLREIVPWRWLQQAGAGWSSPFNASFACACVGNWSGLLCNLTTVRTSIALRAKGEIVPR